MNTPDHYRDNRLQWWFGRGPAARAHLRATATAGVIGFLFGGGAAGTTGDTSDGGYFFQAADRYRSAPLGSENPGSG